MKLFIIIKGGDFIKNTKKKILKTFISIAMIIIVTIFGKFTATDEKNREIETSSDLEVHFIDVGQGDSTLLKCNDKVALIDGGENYASSKVVSYIEKLGIKKIDYIIATHPHSDHISGLIGVIKKFEVENIMKNEEEFNSQLYKKFVNAYSEKNINVITPKLGDEFSLGESKIKILGPTAYNFDTNNNSLVIKVSHGNNSLLFTGDGEKIEESSIMYTGENIEAKILHIGHHGSRKASSDEFLKEVNPEYGIISVGKNNQYGHPHKEVIDRLEKNDINYYRTDKKGDIIVKSDGNNFTFSTEK